MAIVTSEESVKPRRFTVDEYYRMGEVGILKPDERVELVDGEVYVIGPISSRHAACLTRLSDLGHRQLAGRMRVRVRSPVRLGPDGEPQPGLALVRPRDDDYISGHPEPADIFVLIEVMEISASFDRGRRLSLYARAGIVEVWLVDLECEVVEVYRHPEGDVYTEIHVFARGQLVACAAFPDLELAVTDIFG